VWGGHHRRTNSRVFKHASCSTQLSDDASCPTCKLTPGLEQIITEPKRGRRRLRDDPVAVALRGPHRMLEPVNIS